MHTLYFCHALCTDVQALFHHGYCMIGLIEKLLRCSSVPCSNVYIHALYHDMRKRVYVMCVHLYVCIHVVNMCTYACIDISLFTRRCIGIHAFWDACIRVHTCMYTYIHTYVHTYRQAHTSCFCDSSVSLPLAHTHKFTWTYIPRVHTWTLPSEPNNQPRLLKATVMVVKVRGAPKGARRNVSPSEILRRLGGRIAAFVALHKCALRSARWRDARLKWLCVSLAAMFSVCVLHRFVLCQFALFCVLDCILFRRLLCVLQVVFWYCFRGCVGLALISCARGSVAINTTGW